MKLKTVAIEGKTYAEVSAEGNPIYVHTDGKEVPFDAAHAVEKIDQLNGEAKGHRVEKEKAELALKAFDGLDAESARTAMTTVKGYEAKQLIDNSGLPVHSAITLEEAANKVKEVLGN